MSRQLVVLVAVVFALTFGIANLINHVLGPSGASAGGNSSPYGQSTPVLVTPPEITGTSEEGELLVASPGEWAGPGVKLNITWERCDSAGASCVPIPSETDRSQPTTGSQYRAVVEDVGHALRVDVDAENSKGRAEAPSKPTGVVAPKPALPPTEDPPPTDDPPPADDPPPPPDDTTAPSEPTQLKVTSATVSTISVSWGAATDNVGVVSYEVYRGSTLVKSVEGLTADVDGLQCGTTYVMGVAAKDEAGNSSAKATVSATTSECPPAPTPTCAAGEWLGAYYANTALSSKPVVQRCDAKIDFAWGTGSPAASVPTDGFSARWTGTFSFPSGSTTFTVTADDGVRLLVDGSVVLDKWVDQPSTTYKVDRTLTAGDHSLKVEYYERTGGADIHVSWGATPTGPASTGTVAFTGDWETGDASQWTWGVQCANVGTSDTLSLGRGTLNVVGSPVSQGSYAARFDLPAYNGRNACEVLRKRTLNIGSDDYYRVNYFLPADWKEPSSYGWGAAIAQFNYQGIYGPSVGLFAHGDHVRLVTQTGYCNDSYSSSPGCAYSSGAGGNLPETDIVPRGKLAAGRWLQLLVHVHWAKDGTGVVEGWYRYADGSTWTKSVEQRGYPTVQWSASNPGSSGSTTSDKIGAYRGASTSPLTIWSDDFRVGTSFSAVS